MNKFFAALISVLPFNVVRIFLYRNLCKYKIGPAAKIAPFNIILSKDCVLGNIVIGPFNLLSAMSIVIDDRVSLGRFNRVKNVSSLFIGPGSHIGSWNVFFGTKPGLSPFKSHECMKIGQGSVITNHHSFDLSDEIFMGDDVTIAGSGTQFWTHGFDLGHVKIQAPIRIGSHIYIGSRSLITQGVEIVDGTIVGAGTTVAGKISEPGFYVSSKLVRKSPVSSYLDETTVTKGGYNFHRRA